jgi:GR25 family glycosyltransferase involved in LPS biosynthesis
MDKIDKIYYINLNRRQDRNENFLNECNKANLPTDKIVRFEAIDGKIYHFNETENNLFNNVDFKNNTFDNPYTIGSLKGNQLSHYYILKNMVEKNYDYIIICQDDVIFRNNFTNYLTKVMDSIPADAEIINVGFHSYAVYEHFIKWDFNEDNDALNIGKKYNDNICILNDGENPCSLAYIVTKQGAKNLVEYFEKTGFLRSTDYNFNDYLKDKNIFYAANTVLCTGNPQFGSDIFGK